MTARRTKSNTTSTVDLDEAAPAELTPVDLDPPDPTIARWQTLANVDLVINHDDDAELVIPFPRPAWAQPDEDYVGKSICSTWYNSDTVSIPTSHMGGESRGGAVLPSGLRVRGRLCGDGWHGVGMTLFRFIDDEWTDLGCTMTVDEARKLAEVLLAAVDMVGGDK